MRIWKGQIIQRKSARTEDKSCMGDQVNNVVNTMDRLIIEWRCGQDNRTFCEDQGGKAHGRKVLLGPWGICHGREVLLGP